MRDVTIRDYIGAEKELTADQVKKLPAGTLIVLHSFDRHGSHCTEVFTVAQSGKKKILVHTDFYHGRIEKPIRQATDRFCYTEV